MSKQFFAEAASQISNLALQFRVCGSGTNSQLKNQHISVIFQPFLHSEAPRAETANRIQEFSEEILRFCSSINRICDVSRICFTLLLLDLVAHTPDHLQISRLLGINLDLLPNMSDMYCHRIISPNSLLIPDAFIDLIDREHPAAVLHQ